MTAVGIIPVRFASSRFPGKPLADLCGKPMIQWVYEQSQKSRLLEQVIVATDDERIYEAVAGFGGSVLMTSPEHSCGTSRVAEAAEHLSSEIVINIQGDEPLIEPEMIDQVVRLMQADTAVYMATLKKRITSKDDVNNPHIVKVVTDINGFALYFSRAGIPYERQSVGADLCVCPLYGWYKHIGLYGYCREFLLTIDKLPHSSLEAAESLEQLRILENGCKIRVLETEYDTIGVDTPEDLMRVAGMMRGNYDNIQKPCP